MAENINISFAPNKNADEAQRIADIENYLQTLTERTKFAFSTIIEDYGESVTSNNSHAISGLSRLTNAVIYNDPVIISQDDANYLEYQYEIVDYYAGDIVTFGQSGNPIIVQGNPVYKDAPKELFSGLTSSVAFNEYSESYHLEKISYDKDGNETGRTYKQTISYLKNGVWNTYVFTRSCAAGTEYLLRATYEEICCPSDDYPYGCALIHTYGYNTVQSLDMSSYKTYCAFSSAAEYNAALNLTKSTLKKQSVSQTTIKSENYDSSANLPQIGVPDTIYTTTEPAAVWRYDSKNKKYVCVGRDYNEINEIKSDIYGADEAGAMKLPVRQLTKSTEEWKADSTIYPRGMMLIAQDIETELGRRKSVIRIANGIDIWSDLSDTNYISIATSDTLGGVKIGDNITVADDGTISVDLSRYLQSADIADWAKQPNKPVYTADEVGAAAEQHKHNTADITDFPAIPKKVSELQNDSGYISEETDPTVPAWAKAETKPTYTAAEVGAATVADIKAAVDGIEIGGRNYLLNTKTFSTASSTALSGALLSGAAGLSDETYYGLSVRGGTLTTTQMEVCRYGFNYFNLGDTFTFSFFAKGNINELRVFFYGYTGYVQVAKCVNSQGETNTNADGRCSFTVSDSWKRYWVRWTLKTTGDTTIPKWILIRAYNAQIGQEIYICGCKLEKGNVNTDWSPDPEDYYSLAERVSALEAAALAGGE